MQNDNVTCFFFGFYTQVFSPFFGYEVNLIWNGNSNQQNTSNKDDFKEHDVLCKTLVLKIENGFRKHCIQTLKGQEPGMIQPR